MTCLHNHDQNTRISAKNIFERFSDLPKLSLCFNTTVIPLHLWLFTNELALNDELVDTFVNVQMNVTFNKQIEENIEIERFNDSKDTETSLLLNWWHHKAHLHWQKPKSQKPGFFVVPFTLPEKPITFGFFGTKSACAKNPESLLFFW